MTYQRPKRLRRVQLATPASSEKMSAKAAASAADHVFLDLEDAVAPSAKVGARATAVNSHVKITRTASRVTAVIKIEKPAKKAGTHGSKVAAEQLTARKQKSAKVAHNEKPAHGHKHKSQKIAQK